MALFTFLNPHALAVDADESRVTETSLFTPGFVTLPAGLRTLFRTSLSTVRIMLIISMALVAVVVRNTPAPDPHKAFLTEAATSTLFGAVTFVARLFTVPATRLEHLMGSTLLVALPIWHTLSAHSDESFGTETTLLALAGGTTPLVAVAVFFTRPSAVLVHFIFRTLLLTAFLAGMVGLRTISDFNTESSEWVSRVAWFAVASLGTNQGLDVARLP